MTIEYIILHHSATKDGLVVDTQAIRRYHTSYAYEGQIIKKTNALALIEQGKQVKKPWEAIGYHWLCEKVNDHYEIIMGRMPNTVGAHTVGYNHNSWGVCAVGNFDSEAPPPDQWDMLVKLCSWIVTDKNIKVSNIKGHRDFANKTCPGTMFDLQRFRDDVARSLIKMQTPFNVV